jgi:hypothetical protein
MNQFVTKRLWDRSVIIGLLGLALLAGFAAGLRVVLILHGS